jgi:hypothetical protein
MYPFDGLALSSYESYRTPLGQLSVDRTAVGKLLRSESSFISEFNEAHIPEHALEVELPFIQTLFPDIEIVPMICGQISGESADELARVLAPLLVPENLWVISSDFTHFGLSFGYKPFSDKLPERLKDLDMGAVKPILDIDSEGFASYVEKTGATICGANPIRVLLRTMEKVRSGKPLFKPELVAYTTSGELTGDYSHCVSYAGIAVYGKN